MAEDVVSLILILILISLFSETGNVLTEGILEDGRKQMCDKTCRANGQKVYIILCITNF